MKQVTLLLIFLVSFSFATFAKKDINAWKNAKNLEEQFEIFKENLNFWNGSYFLKEDQINDFYKALRDSIGVYEKLVVESREKSQKLQEELNAKIEEAKAIQAKLDRSMELENSISLFGVDINKTVYSTSMYLLIVGVLLVAVLLLLLYKRSNKITAHTKRDYEDLKEEYETHKKNALDRYVKINNELTRARMELNRR
jgi:biopolymer transport protein ExbB/TolQ